LDPTEYGFSNSLKYMALPRGLEPLFSP
jgi:hypothetical protein